MNYGNEKIISRYKKREIRKHLINRPIRYRVRRLHKKIPMELKNFYLVQGVDPIVSTVARESQIDFPNDDNMPNLGLFIFVDALLIANHPKINEAIAKIRSDLGLLNLLQYAEYTKRQSNYINTAFKNGKLPTNKTLNASLDRFFSQEGRNLSQQVWESQILTWIFTGILPLPWGHEPSSLFSLQLPITKDDLLFIENYPAVIIKRRINGHNLNQLIQYIRDSEPELIRITKDLPNPPVKRKDVDITKLAIGLWVYRNEKRGLKWVLDWVDKKYEHDEKFFGKYDSVTYTELSNDKSDALIYLDHLFSLK